jgi:hypothetical protein
VQFGLSFLRMTFNFKADAQPGRGQRKPSTPSTRGRGHATLEQACKSETGTVQLRMNPMPLPLRHGRARGACRPRGIMSGSGRPPCRLTASRGRMPASPEGRPRRKITIEAKSDGMPRRETTRGTESRSPSPLAFGRTRRDVVQGLRPFNQIQQESTAFPLNRKIAFFTPSSAFIKKATISSIPFSTLVHNSDSILQIDTILVTCLIHLSQRKCPALTAFLGAR